MHRGEAASLALLVPATVAVACWQLFGAWLALPAAFLAMNFLPFILAGTSPASQWRLWLAGLVLWAWFFRDAGGVVGVVAWFWLLGGLANLLACGLLGLGRMLAWPGFSGIALRLALLILTHAAAVWIGFRWGWQWGVGAGGWIAAVACAAVLRPGCQWLGPVTTDGADGVLITIDDGPDPQDTPVLLDLLDQYQVRAVFFMIGEKAARHPELVREVVRRGHELGNHTLTHPQATFWCAGPRRTRREIAGCQQILEESSGQAPRWFRAPVGHRNLFTHPVAATLGLRVMGWNRRGYDAVETDPAKVLARILPDLRRGDIILLHEATPIAREVLAGVLEKCADAGLLKVSPSRSGDC